MLFRSDTLIEVENLKGSFQRELKKIEAGTRADQRADTLFNAATALAQNVEPKIANIMKSPRYTNAVTMAALDPTGKSADMQKRIKEAQDFLDKSETAFEKMRVDAQEAVDRARAKVEGTTYTGPSTDKGKGEPAPTGDRPPLSSFGKTQPAPTASSGTTTSAPAPAEASTSVEDTKKYIREKSPRGGWVYTESSRGLPMRYYKQKDAAKE